MLTDAIIAEGLRLDTVERANLRGRLVYTDNPFLQHALTHYAAALREVVRLREAIAEQFLLQYGKEPDDLERAITKLIRMRQERIQLDKALEATNG